MNITPEMADELLRFELTDEQRLRRTVDKLRLAVETDATNKPQLLVMDLDTYDRMTQLWCKGWGPLGIPIRQTKTQMGAWFVALVEAQAPKIVLMVDEHGEGHVLYWGKMA